MDLAKFVEEIINTQDHIKLYEHLEKVLADECGYDRVIFTLVSDHPRLDLTAGHGIMRNYPDDWMKHYIEKGYENIDPVTRFGVRSVGPFIWDDLPLVMNLTPGQNICMNESREAGLNNGAGVCLRGGAGEVAGLGVAMSDQKRLDNGREVKHKLALLNAISHLFYASFCNMSNKQIRQKPIEEVMLTKREIEVLRHMVLAKKDYVIALDLNMSVHAVDFHVRNILKKFNAPTRTSAILKAINSGVVASESSVWIRQSSQVARV